MGNLPINFGNCQNNLAQSPTHTQFSRLLLSNKQIQNNQNLLNPIMMNNGNYLMNINPNPNLNSDQLYPFILSQNVERVGPNILNPVMNNGNNFINPIYTIPRK